MKKATLKKVAVAEEELDDTDDIGNLEDLPRHMFIDEECTEAATGGVLWK